MVTIYDLLEVSEKASKEEIEKSYQKLVIDYQTNPIHTEEENKKNELILNKLKLAFEILMNDEKRQKYDRDLAKKRAEELIKNIPEKREEKEDNTDYTSKESSKPENIAKAQSHKLENSISNTNKSIVINEEKNDNTEYDEIPKAKNTRDKSGAQDEESILSKEEQKKLRKAAQKEFNENLKKVQKAEEEYNNAYNEAYRKYMKKMGYESKEPSMFKKIRNALIVIISIILVCIIAWIIPPVRKELINLYEGNAIIKFFVNIIGAIIKSILSIFE